MEIRMPASSPCSMQAAGVSCPLDEASGPNETKSKLKKKVVEYRITSCRIPVKELLGFIQGIVTMAQMAVSVNSEALFAAVLILRSLLVGCGPQPLCPTSAFLPARLLPRACDK